MDRDILLIFALLCAVSHYCGTSEAASCPLPATQNSVTKTFTPMADTFVLLNPERGFYHDLYVYTSAYEPLDPVDLRNAQTTNNISIVLLDYTLDSFVTSSISSTVLGKMRTDFQTLRNLAMKCVLRFAYTQNDGDTKDAVLSLLLAHIDQLTPILQDNIDVIMAVQAGFIGTYGEWYFSRNYATLTPDGDYVPSAKQQAARNTIVAALLQSLPSSRMIQLRTPSLKQKYCNTTANLTPQQAFSTTVPCARIGIHNDCFMASNGDQGTFESNAQRAWLTNEALYTMTGGESCEVTAQTTCSGGQTAIAAQRFSYLNLAYHESVIAGWRTNNCFKTIANMMGYRFLLVNGTFSTIVARGGTYLASLAIKNTGVAPLYISRPVQAILRNRADGALTTFAQAQIDPRQWAPGTTSTVCLSFVVPAGQAAGTYDVILNLPDASSSLANKPLARILLANGGGVQEFSTRFNVLGQVTIV